MNRHFNITLIALTVFLWTSISNVLKAQENEPLQVSPAQVTFFYPLGTDSRTSLLSSYHFSLNMLWGITGGVNGAEIGSLVNQTKGDLKGAQFGGVANLVSGRVLGGQFAGIINTSSVLRGVQFGGIVNLADASSGEEDELSTGFQAAGILNIESRSLEGAQMALINITKDNLKGAQIGGLFNKTSTLSGVQIGLINMADTVEKGVQIGLLNLVKHGMYTAMEIESNESFYANATYKLGTPRFYSIISLGFRTQNQTEIWAPGFGFGTYFPVGNITGINIDAISYHVNEGEWWTSEENSLHKLKVNCSFQVAPKVTLFGGFSMNLSVSSIKDVEGIPTGSSLKTPGSFYEATNAHRHLKLYPGFNAGIRF